MVWDSTPPLKRTVSQSCAILPQQECNYTPAHQTALSHPRNLCPSANPRGGGAEKKLAFLLQEHHIVLLICFKILLPLETLNSLLCEQPDKEPGKGPLVGQQEVSWDKRSKLRNASLGSLSMCSLGSLSLGQSQHKNVLRVTVGFD